MGVPMVTLRGRTMPSRIAASLMEQYALGDWIADDLQGYAARALGLASDPALRQSIRAHLAAARRGAGAPDGLQFTREFEDALTYMAGRARHALPPQARLIGKAGSAGTRVEPG